MFKLLKTLLRYNYLRYILLSIRKSEHSNRLAVAVIYKKNDHVPTSHECRQSKGITILFPNYAKSAY